MSDLNFIYVPLTEGDIRVILVGLANLSSFDPGDVIDRLEAASDKLANASRNEK